MSHAWHFHSGRRPRPSVICNVVSADCSLWSGNVNDLSHARREELSVLLAVVGSILPLVEGWLCAFSLLLCFKHVRWCCVIIAEILR